MLANTFTEGIKNSPKLFLCVFIKLLFSVTFLEKLGTIPFRSSPTYMRKSEE